MREFVHRKPTIRESHALDCAALYAERARLAATDPSMTPDMLCKLAAAARYARDLLAAVAAERAPRRAPADTPALPSFGEMAAHARAASGARV